jgi:hypothetical protein
MARQREPAGPQERETTRLVDGWRQLVLLLGALEWTAPARRPPPPAGVVSRSDAWSRCGTDIATRSVTGISVAQFGSSAAGTMYFDTGGVFFRDETVFLNQRKRPETKLRASCL